MTNVIYFPRPHRDDPDAVKREIRKRLGRERHQSAQDAAARMIELRGVIREAMGKIANVVGTDAMTKWVEQDLAAWKVRSCTNE